MRAHALAPVVGLALLACSDGATAPPPPLPQVLLYVDTDAPVPPAPGDTPGPDDPLPLFDTLRIDVYEPGGAQPCTGCSRDFAVDAGLLRARNLSVGIPLPLGAAGWTARVRLYPRRAVVGTEPHPNATLDAYVALPTLEDDAVVEESLLLSTDTVGTTAGSLDAPGALQPGPPAASLVATWAHAAQVPCNGDPQPDEACVTGGAFWMGNLALVGVANLPRLVVVSPFFVKMTEVTVGEMRASRPARIGTHEEEAVCTYTTQPGSLESYALNCVDWQTARTFCQQQHGDLPSEAQFEYVASARTGQLFEWGSDGPGCGDVVWGASEGCSVTGPRPPGSGPLDGIDLPGGRVVDLAGNLAEYAVDQWNGLEEGCWSHPGVFVDPVCQTPSTEAWAVGGASNVRRGGGWTDPAIYGAAAWRLPTWRPPTTNIDIGFRCVRPAS